ncbi:unnamed protein product [Rhizoctonia solani]|uniref:Nephrocystin 3-like N-terminal domain-containing protein n=1 Tax=Rhizoctonia solani TaxID=456999 RepID=A0A8H3HUC8_9AGAM|nr:unnamed protein product [Rhizoctonia solani]
MRSGVKWLKDIMKRQSPSNPWSQLATSLRALETGVELFPPLRSAVGAFIGCLDIVEKAAQNRADQEKLVNELQLMTDMLKKYAGELEQEPSNGSAANIAQCIQRQVVDIKQKHDYGTGRRLLDATHDQEDVIRCYRQVERLFRQLQTDLSMRTKQEVRKIHEWTLLQRIAPVDDARYNSSYSDTIRRRACTAQTREAIHQELQKWTTNPETEMIYWMNGMAGTGKTTIAYSYCEWLESTNRLGASFFCSRISSTCRSLSQIVPTVAYQLAHFSPAFRSRLCGTLNDDPVAGKLNVGQQFEKLLYQPLLAVKNAMPDDVVIVIDALDECDDNYSVRLLLDVLLKFAEHLPLKFFVASRPEPVIRDRMMSQGGSSRHIVYLHDIEQSIVEEDIKTYLTEALNPMEPSPSQAQIVLLAKRSRNLFIYAATVVRYIYPDDVSVDSGARLELMLDTIGTSDGTSTNRYKDLDLLYTTVLSAVFKSDLDYDEKDRMRCVLWTVVCALEPIPAVTIAFLAALTERQVMSALQPLRSVVHVPENSSLISPLHASFPEFMLAESRSQKFHCNESKSSEILAHRCFEAMKLELRFNICSLQSSYLPDDKVQDLEARVSRCIPPTLSYACRYWSSHLRIAPTTNHTVDLLFDFLSNRLLFWMEVLSFSRCIGTGAPMIQQVQTWLQQAQNNQDETQKQLSDARNFITWFAANPCSQSTPHIYISALAFCAKSSWIYQNYSQRTHGLASMSVSGHNEAMLAVLNVGYSAVSLAISPQGDRIAVGSKNGSIQIYDVHTGALVAGPFNGHTDSVNSVAFSPSGTRIATGSDDKTIMVWDALTGRTVTGPLHKHTSYVQSVAFSSDGKRVVSGSFDETIIVWDSSTGTIALGPLQGHTDIIWSVCFSPTAPLIATGSSDKSVRLWDAQTGAAVAELKGHKDSIHKTVFSSDGSRLASCSFDKTIRFWDVETRAAIGQPLTGHNSGILSMAFSSDDMHIISSTVGDGHIIVWNTLTGSPVLGPFSGHSREVRSVVFSRDNSQGISCSDDQTIRIWDIQSKNKVPNQQRTHNASFGPVAFLPNPAKIISSSSTGVLKAWDMFTGKPTPVEVEEQTKLNIIHSLAVSPQGRHVATGADDGIIRAWDILTGKEAFRPLREHTHTISSLAFSPDGTRLCSGSDDATIIVWDVATAVMVGQPYRGHTNAVTSVAYSPNGTRIASGAADCTIRVWNSLTGVALHTLNGHKAPVLSVVFSPSGSRIASGSRDGVVRTWEVRDGDCSGVNLNFEQHNNLFSSHSVSFSPNGDRLVSGFGPSVRIFSAWSVKPISSFSLPHFEETRWVGYSADNTNIISVSVPKNTSASEIKDERNHQSPNIVRVWCANTTPGQLASSSTPARWSYEPDGRISSPEGFVMWIPPDLVPHMKAHNELVSPDFYSPLVLSPDRFINIGYPDLCIGERWTECYIDKE